MKQEWIKRVNRKDWQPNSDSRICSEHFLDFDQETGKPSSLNPCPVLKMGYELPESCQKQKRKPPTKRDSPPTKRLKQLNLSDQLNVVTDNMPMETENVAKEQTGDPAEPVCKGCKAQAHRIKVLQKEVQHWKNLFFSKKKATFYSEILNSDSKVKSYTGLQSKAVFDTLYGSFGEKVKKLRHWNGPARTVSLNRNGKNKNNTRKPKALTGKEEFFMTLLRTKTMMKAEVLGDFFGVSPAVVSTTCVTWWKFLAKELGSLVYNPTEEAHKALLPASFQCAQYRNVKHIADCTEIFTETPKNKTVQAVTWSNYKHHNTCKYLLSVTASGHINFVSKGYGGRASDRQIVEQSGFLEELRKGEQVMADKGFNISDLVTLKHAEVLIPPGRTGAFQMPARDVHKTKAIANRRIRVEQVIRRLKCFNILKYEVPITLLHSLDNIVIVCCALSNLMPPISKQ